MNTYSQRFRDQIPSIKQEIPVYRGDNWLKIHQNSNMFMTLWRKKCQSKVKCEGFLTRFIENTAFAVFTRYKNVASTKWHHMAAAPISIVLLHYVR